MPGWHERTQPFVDEDRLQVVGIVQEQHAERARLFMQWKGLAWPLLVDSLNLMGVEGIPLTYFLDEQGTVRAVNPRPSQLNAFMRQKPLPWSGSDWLAPDPSDLLSESGLSDKEAATRLVLWGQEPGLDRAIERLESIVSEAPDEASAHFRLGVAYRCRFDGPGRLPSDFREAVQSWGRALGLNPNQYIWRRRIQQYGPRLDKPYSFYDWVRQARRELAARGEVPLRLAIEPAGAEFADPQVEFPDEASVETDPDPEGKVARDTAEWIAVEAVAVPAMVGGGEAVRIHLELTPDSDRMVHWNNEGEDLIIWMNDDSNWQFEKRFQRHPNPPLPISMEGRRLEFEIRSSKRIRAGEHRLRGYALYSVCDALNGQCLYRRQDFSVIVQVKGEQ